MLPFKYFVPILLRFANWREYMVRISKQEERRSRNPHRCRAPAKKTGPKTDKLPQGFKPHTNAVAGEMSERIFVPKIG